MGDYANPGALVSTDWLAEHLDDPNVRTIEVDENSAAYEAYLKGMFYRNQFTSAGFEKALVCFRQAVEQDPVDPLLWAGLALSYAMVSHSDLPARQAMIGSRATRLSMPSMASATSRPRPSS